MNKEIIETMAKGSVEAFNLGITVERDRLIKLIKPHIEVCNYESVTDEACDVCFWVRETLTALAGGSSAA
jgi:hypothetical protein